MRVMLLFLVLSTQASFAQTKSCKSVFSSGVSIFKAQYLAMDIYGKQNFLKNIFSVGSDLNLRFRDYDNLSVSEPMKIFNSLEHSFDPKLKAAAIKVLKQYELDSRENITQLVATVLFEKKELLPGQVNPWAVLISKKIINTRGQSNLEPVAIYSMERSGSNEVMIPILNSFEGLII